MEKIVKGLRKGTKLQGAHGEYIIDSVLGAGNFGITYKAKCKVKVDHVTHTVYYAIKEFFISSICSRNDNGTVTVNEAQETNYNHHRKAFIKEACMLYELPPNEGIVKVNEYFDANNTTYYVMEFLEESLTEKVKSSNDGRLSERQALNMFIKVASAVSSLHDNNRLHLDIKPDNIMIKDGEPKLIDFSQSRVFDAQGNLVNSDSDCVCSDGYSPLEQYDCIQRFLPAADVYALGATLYYMLTGERPSKAQDLNTSVVMSKLPATISDDTKRLISGALDNNLSSRFKSVADMLSVIGVIFSDTDGSETRLIDEPTYHKPVFKRTARIVVGALAVVAIIALVANFIMNNESYITDRGPYPSRKDTIAKKNVTEKVDKHSEQESKGTKPSKVIEDEETAPIAPLKTVQPSAPVSPVAPNKSVSKPTLDYATWTGKIVNGKPDGSGVMKFTKSCVIPGTSRHVSAGDVFDGTFYKGKMVNGELNGKFIEEEE